MNNAANLELGTSTPRATQGGAATAVEVSHLGHRYGTRQALDDVSFTVGAGEIFGLLGPNGGGKTTLFRVLSTLMLPATGTVRVFGDDVTTAAQAARRH